jgi:quaternary ammonium compound-resistance protein SugE
LTCNNRASVAKASDIIASGHAVISPLSYALEIASPGGSMAWFLLCVAGVFETAWAVGLKYSDGFSRLVPSVLTVAAMAASIVLLSIALKSLPVGTAYAVWTGIGAAGTAVLGMYLFQEPATVLRLASIALVIAGIAGLKLAS